MQSAALARRRGDRSTICLDCPRDVGGCRLLLRLELLDLRLELLDLLEQLLAVGSAVAGSAGDGRPAAASRERPQRRRDDWPLRRIHHAPSSFRRMRTSIPWSSTQDATDRFRRTERRMQSRDERTINGGALSATRAAAVGTCLGAAGRRRRVDAGRRRSDAVGQHLGRRADACRTAACRRPTARPRRRSAAARERAIGSPADAAPRVRGVGVVRLGAEEHRRRRSAGSSRARSRH